MLMGAAHQANAATVSISLSPDFTAVSVGQAFQITILGQYDGPATLAGGAIDIDFDPAVLRADSVQVNPAVADFAASVGTIDNLSGHIEAIGFASFFGVSGQFHVATLGFTAIGSGASALEASDAGDPVYVWTNYDFLSGPSGGSVTPSFSGADVSVVPLPAAAFMFAPALAGLWIGRRGRAASA
ncbi:MAG: cohesin domain-containing protein [Gammaproteobacteria bacterium]